MDIGSIFLLLALLVPVIIFISRPLLERSTFITRRAKLDISTLLAERDQVIASLQELDDDFRLGKIPAENYPTRRTALLQSGADILRQIDSYQLVSPPLSTEHPRDTTLVAEPTNHEGIASTPRKNGNGVPPVPDDDLEQKIASRRRTRQGKAGGFCPKCGRPVQASDRFCPKCGAVLA